MEDVLTTLPFGNLVERVEITGQTLLDVLAHAISGYNPSSPPGAFLQMSGSERFNLKFKHVDCRHFQ